MDPGHDYRFGGFSQSGRPGLHCDQCHALLTHWVHYRPEVKYKSTTEYTADLSYGIVHITVQQSPLQLWGKVYGNSTTECGTNWWSRFFGDLYLKAFIFHTKIMSWSLISTVQFSCFFVRYRYLILYYKMVFVITFFVYFFGGLECVGHSFPYVAHLWFLRDVWIRTQSAAVASWRVTDLATHPSA